MKRFFQLTVVAAALAVMVYGCGEQGSSPSSPQFSGSASTSQQIDCGDIGYLSQLSPVLPMWRDSLQTWLDDSSLLDETPQWTDLSTVTGYLGDLVPVLQQWQPAINGALASALLDSVANFDPSSSTGDYITGLSSLLVAWKDSLDTRHGSAFLATLPAYQRDETAPVIACVADTSIGCAGGEGVAVEFEVTATDECDPAPVVTCEPASGSVFPVGTTTVTCTAMDFSGNTSTCTFDVTVATDEEPPVVRDVSASPNVLWPPNHKWVDVRIVLDAVDECDGVTACEILDVTSNEPINGTGDGNTEPDWMVTGGDTLKLRAERSGNLTGRVYYVHGRCSDDSGNATEFTVEVKVPHDQSGK